MTFDDYQAGAARTSAAPWPERERLMVQTLGLCDCLACRAKA
jgi:hypothetical protein